MAVTITYGDEDLFGLQPIPFVSKDVNYVQIGERWCQEESISLNGQFVGCSESELRGLRNSLINKLLTNFQSLHIDGLGTANPTFPIVKIQDISFGDSDYVNILPYTISFLHYPEASFSDLFANSYGVTDVSDEISYREGEDRVLETVRTISARGINTSALTPGNAITNVQNFINEQVNKEVPKPYIINSQDSDFGKYLVSSQETIDRIGNIISVTQTFRGDLDRPEGNLVNRYTVNISEQLGEFPRVTYNGQINVGRGGDVDKAYDEYRDLKGSILNASYLFDENVTEDAYINQVNYSFSFFSGDGASNLPKIEDDFSISVSESSNSSLVSASINGTLRFGYGCFADNSEDLSAQFNTLNSKDGVNLHFDLCKEIYEEFYKTDRGHGHEDERPDNVLLNPLPLNKSNSRSYGAGDASNLEISYYANFDDRYVPDIFIPDPKDDFDGLLVFGDSISVSPSITRQQISEHFSGGKYSCNDLGYLSRQSTNISFSINGNDLDLATVGNFRGFAELIYGELFEDTEGKKKKLAESIAKSDESKNASYQVSYSDKGEEFVIEEG